MIEVNIKKIHPNAVIPTYATEGDACMDLTAVEIVEVESADGKHGYLEYKSGLAFEIPKGYFGFVRPRSSVSKTGLIEATSGIIDSGYRGEVTFRYKYIPGTAKFEVGDRFAQIVILPYPIVVLKEVEELSDSARGTGGFGSTGK